MRNLRAPRRSLLPLLLLSTVLLLVAAAPESPAVAAVNSDVGTLQVQGSFIKKFGPIDCAAGTAATTICFTETPVRGDVVPGLGDVTFAPYTSYWDNFGSPCGHVHAQIPILVAGKGEIDLAVAVTGCWAGDNFPPAAVTVSGGSGRYAGASGSGTLEYRTANITGPLSGTRSIIWKGTVNVAGLAFDTTPPQIAGARSKVVRTRVPAGKRVRYSVSAADAIDGPVSAACLPRSGSVFRIGRTSVNCTAADGSGNNATASFVITVTRIRR